MHSWHLFFATLEHSSKQLNRILRTQSERPGLLHCLSLSLSVLSFHCLFSITFTSIVTVAIIFLIMVTVPVYVNVSFITTITFTTTATVTFNVTFTITVSIAITVSFTLFYSVTVPLLSLNFSHCPLGYYFHCFFHFYGYFICFLHCHFKYLF